MDTAPTPATPTPMYPDGAQLVAGDTAGLKALKPQSCKASNLQTPAGVTAADDPLVAAGDGALAVPGGGQLVAEAGLLLTAAPAAERHPVAVYLARLAVRSRRTMLGALQCAGAADRSWLQMFTFLDS